MRPTLSSSASQRIVGWITLGTSLALLPLLLDPYPLILLSSALALSIGCLGVNLLMGYTGLLSLGHAGYFGLGAYAGALLVTFGDVRSLEIYLVAGVLASTAVAALFGSLCVRTTRIFFSILTLALAQIVHSLFISGAAFKPFGDMGKGFFLIGNGGLYIPRDQQVIVGGAYRSDRHRTARGRGRRCTSPASMLLNSLETLTLTHPNELPADRAGLR